jgi:hypothetical protein
MRLCRPRNGIALVKKGEAQLAAENIVDAINPSVFPDATFPAAKNLLARSLWLLWQGIRLPTFLLLSILEPVVSLVLGSLALLGVLTAFFWMFVGPPHFPFLLVLGVSLGFELVLVVYHKLLGFLGRRHPAVRLRNPEDRPPLHALRLPNAIHPFDPSET